MKKCLSGESLTLCFILSTSSRCSLHCFTKLCASLAYMRRASRVNITLWLHQLRCSRVRSGKETQSKTEPLRSFNLIKISDTAVKLSETTFTLTGLPKSSPRFLPIHSALNSGFSYVAPNTSFTLPWRFYPAVSFKPKIMIFLLLSSTTTSFTIVLIFIHSPLYFLTTSLYDFSSVFSVFWTPD